MATTALSALMSDNPRYQEMFDVEKEGANSGVDLTRDYTDDMNALRDASPVHKGSLRELLGVPEIPYALGPERESYTFFSYRACEIGFRENLIFSSEGYNESPGVRSIGTTILSMVGKPHKRLRSAAQPLFKRPKVLNWWNKRWIEETVDALLDRLVGQQTADLNPELCARLPMATVTRAIGLEGEDVLEFRYMLNRATFGAARLPPEDSAAAREWVDQTLRDLIAQNMRDPGDNIIAGAARERDQERGRHQPQAHRGRAVRLLQADDLRRRRHHLAPARHHHRRIGSRTTHFWEACRDDRALVGSRGGRGAALARDPTRCSRGCASRTPKSRARWSPPDRASTCAWAPPTTIPRCSRTPSNTTSSARRSTTWASASVRTAASASMSRARR